MAAGLKRNHAIGFIIAQRHSTTKPQSNWHKPDSTPGNGVKKLREWIESHEK